MSQKDSTPDTSSFWRKLLLLPLIPLLPLYLVLLALFLVGGYVFTEAQRRMRAWQLRGTMQKAARTATWADIEADLASGIGTVIVDAPCLGWNDADIWWTRESVTQRAAIEGLTLLNKSSTDSMRDEHDARMKESEFDRWCEVRYFDPARGMAKLVQTSHSRRDRDKLKSRIENLKSTFSTIEYVGTHSGLARMAIKANQSDES